MATDLQMATLMFYHTDYLLSASEFPKNLLSPFQITVPQLEIQQHFSLKVFKKLNP
jgi:hypothetical protein